MEVTCDVRGGAVSLKCKKEIGLRRPLEVNSRSSLMFFVFYKKNRWDCTGNTRGTWGSCFRCVVYAVIDVREGLYVKLRWWDRMFNWKNQQANPRL